MPRAPHSSALLAGRPSAKRRVFSSSVSRAASMPLSSDSGTLAILADRQQAALGRLPDERVARAGAAVRHRARRKPLQRRRDALQNASPSERPALLCLGLRHHLNPCFSIVAKEGRTAIFAPESRATVARRQRSSGPSMQDILTNPLFMFIPIGLIFYFLVMRPQQQQQKEHRPAIDNLRRGDTVVTAGGLVGRVAKAPTKEDAEVTVEIADNVQVKVVKTTLARCGPRASRSTPKPDKS